ncbi:hypothetical protein HYS50_00975 [Candidatus Woesearchaeota archaeon]|nr:hypothetical protein [Candidatus Woesearchaeota archaeon]
MDALQLRNKLKGKKPTFLRSDAHRVPRLEKKWHAPKGGDNKIRRRLRGHRRQPTVGWRSPRPARNLSPEGFEQVVVYTEADLAKVRGACIIARTLGARKRMHLLKKAQEVKLKVLNFKDVARAIRQIEEDIKARKEQEKARVSKKEKTKQEALKKAAQKEKEPKKEETAEEKAKREAEEKRKVLEQK